MLRGTSAGGESLTPIKTTGTTSYLDASASVGTTYYYAVVAVNGSGGGPFSNEASGVAQSPATAPGQPTAAAAVAGNGQAVVSFTAPAADGGSPITSYTVTSSPGGKTATGTASPITVTGLTNGTPYTFTVTATNTIGTGPASAASNTITARRQARRPDRGAPATPGTRRPSSASPRPPPTADPRSPPTP